MGPLIELASNENPLGCSPAARSAAVEAAAEPSRYPDSSASALKRRLAAFHEVPEACVLVGHGAREIVNELVQSFCRPGDNIVVPPYSFAGYRQAAQIHRIRLIEAEEGRLFEVSLKGIERALRANPGTRLVFVDNPGNPTGHYVEWGPVQAFLGRISDFRDLQVVLDGSYWEYLEPKKLPRAEEMMRAFRNLFVLRTFSKAYGLAGLRIGYALGPAHSISIIEKRRLPYLVNRVGQAAALAALDDQGFVSRTRAHAQDAKRAWRARLRELAIPCFGAEGNFLVLDVMTGLGLGAEEFVERCRDRGVLVRSLAGYGLAGCVRISMGSEGENASAMAAVSQVAAARREFSGVRVAVPSTGDGASGQDPALRERLG